MPTFIHTADWHINALRRLPGYLDRVEQTLAQVTDVAKQRSVNFVVVAGDVFQTRSISHEERRLFSSWLGNLPVPAVIISGNHDQRLESGDTSLCYLSSLSSSMVLNHVIHDGLPVLRELDGVNLALIPFNGWSNQEMVLLVDILVTAARRKNKYPIVVVMHEEVDGAVMDSGYTRTTGLDRRIKLTQHPDVTYWALGHIHKRQELMPGAWYSGSPHQVNFGEDLPKGVMVVSTKRPQAPRFVELKSRPLLTLTELPKTIPTDAYIQLRPTKALGRTHLPPNVTLHPDAHILSKTGMSSLGSQAGLFDLLPEYLEAARLAPELRPMAWSIVKEVADTLDIDVKIPKTEKR